MRYHVDRTRCQGHARCFALARELFAIDDEGLAVATVLDVPAELADALWLAEANCPEQAIEIDD